MGFRSDHFSKPPDFVYNPPPSGDLPLLYEDAHLLIFSKPSGLLSVPGKPAEHFDSLQTRVLEHYPEALLVHRLDMETSGIFIMARNKEVQQNLGKQFERRKVHKVYVARVWGCVDGESGEIDLPLRCDWENRPLQKVCFEHGRPARTHWEVIGRDAISTRMRLTPLTGRSHQLRVHMLELGTQDGGHPILGDDFYAHEAAHEAADRLQLHAESLRLHHPKDGQVVNFTDPCPF
ncbi:MAG: RNA pseudouridine synthase [Alphaproteobacteria bacterium]|nr:RNA pseudouridine synthase [Alphaproteobacteria bacterium]